jgi:4-diphosphocytidyl-2-C-methyl-D-erythritol kinase
MISFPHAKINLGLTVLNKRTDGFHNLETIFYPIPLKEILEIVPSPEFSFRPSGLKISGNTRDNLVVRAYDLLKREFSVIGAVEINLHKAIPMGAGLGGGSSDAAETLLVLDRLFNLKISQTLLNSLAIELGSDCPFFLQPFACHASGRGEHLKPVAIDLSSYSILLVHPEIVIKTAWAFANINPEKKVIDLIKIIQKPVENWKNLLVNDFEKPIFKAYEQLKEIKQKLYDTGAVYASMTGSGSTIFGIFRKGDLPDLAFLGASVQKIDRLPNMFNADI